MGFGILMSIDKLSIVGETLGSWNMFDQWRAGTGINIPIGICLFFMMYPAMLNLQFKEVKKLGKNPLPIIITLVSNWVVAPLVAAGLAYAFLPGNPDLIIAVILLGSSPCTAMVLVWGAMAKGNQEQNVINTSINTVTIMFLYVPIVTLLTGIANLSIDRLVIDSSGNVGLGTTSPISKLEINGSALTDTNSALKISESFSDGVYIDFGKYRKIGVYSGGR